MKILHISGSLPSDPNNFFVSPIWKTKYGPSRVLTTPERIGIFLLYPLIRINNYQVRNGKKGILTYFIK